MKKHLFALFLLTPLCLTQTLCQVNFSNLSLGEAQSTAAHSFNSRARYATPLHASGISFASAWLCDAVVLPRNCNTERHAWPKVIGGLPR